MRMPFEEANLFFQLIEEPLARAGSSLVVPPGRREHSSEASGRNSAIRKAQPAARLRKHGVRREAFLCAALVGVQPAGDLIEPYTLYVGLQLIPFRRRLRIAFGTPIPKQVVFAHAKR